MSLRLSRCSPSRAGRSLRRGASRWTGDSAGSSALAGCGLGLPTARGFRAYCSCSKADLTCVHTWPLQAAASGQPQPALASFRLLGRPGGDY